ncbi:MAG TPA: hypothetical protein VEI50_02335 [Nitrospiraceae bacterium]|nr:hypothetical protein [Nitrospiraceae bacterium]
MPGRRFFHQTLAMVNRYTHLQPGYIDKAVRLVEVRGPGDEFVTTPGEEQSEEDSEDIETAGAGDWNRTSDLRFTNTRPCRLFRYSIAAPTA